MTLYLTAEIVLFVMCILMSIASIGVKDQGMGWRCTALSIVFCAALMAVIALSKH